MNGQNASPPSVEPAWARVLVAASLVLATLFVALILASGPLRIGEWGDDSIYLATAKSLIDGQGYRHPQLPGTPLQTKYPPLYPLALALIWRLAPQFPQNVHLVQVLNVVLWGIGSWFCYLAIRRAWHVPWWLALVGVILAFFSNSTLPLLRAAMSESLYFCFSMAALAMLVHATAAPTGDRPFGPSASPVAAGQTRVTHATGGLSRYAIMAGLLAGFAYLTRPIGLTLIVAVLADLVWHRRWRHAAFAALPAAICVAGWRIWGAQAAARNALHPATSALGYNLGYGRWPPDSLSKLLWAAYHNTSDMALSLSIVLNPFLSLKWIDEQLQAGLPAAAVLYAILLITAAVVIVGAIATWKVGQPTLHIYMACYVGLLWVWPGSPWRFLLVILPMLTVLLLVGVHITVRRLARLVRLRTGGSGATALTSAAPSFGRGPIAPSRLGTGVLIVLGVACALRSMQGNLSPGVRQFGHQYDRIFEALAELFAKHTAPDAVICANNGGYLHLRTGRKFVPYLVYEDPMPYRYPPDRRFLMCGRDYTEGQYNAYMEMIFDHLLDYLHTTGASYLAVDASGKRAFEEFHQTVPERFAEFAVVPPYTVYRVLTPDAQAR